MKNILIILLLILSIGCSTGEERLQIALSSCSDCKMIFRTAPTGDASFEYLLLADTVKEELLLIRINAYNSISKIQRSSTELLCN